MTKPQLLSLLSKPHHGGILTGGNMLVSHDDDQKIMMNMMTMTKMRTQVLCSPPTAENGEEHLMLQQSAPDSKS